MSIQRESSPIFENESCIVINKLPGASSEFTGIGAVCQSPVKPVHRLDTPVSGCLLLAKTPNAAAFLSAAFAGRRVEKRYWAIVEKPAASVVLPESGELVHWLTFNAAKNKSFAHAAGDDGTGGRGRKEAVLRYRLAGTGKHYLFLEIELVTGRHHQIRAQLAAIGLCIKGDLKYGARRSEKAGGIRLHAYSLGFPDPLYADRTISVKALPPEMDALWTAFAETAGGSAAGGQPHSPHPARFTKGTAT